MNMLVLNRSIVGGALVMWFIILEWSVFKDGSILYFYRFITDKRQSNYM